MYYIPFSVRSHEGIQSGGPYHDLQTNKVTSLIKNAILAQ